MITAEIKINTALIGHLYCVNKGPIDGEEYLYECHYYPVGKEVIHFNVAHERSQGAVSLMRVVVNELDDIMREDKEKIGEASE